LNSIAEPALKNADLKLSTKVARIETGVNKVKVVTDKGVEQEFDEVVMTAPLGYLKQNKDTFVPPLPPRLAHAMDAIGYGSLEKV
jgi:monoamine oxidase